MATIAVIKLPESKRSPMTEALYKRHGIRQTSMKDRRTPRGGAKNRQQAFRDDSY
jgi:hypothetical protein